MDKRNRDLGLIDYVGRFGIVTMDHVMAALGVGRASAYRRTAACVQARLLERLELRRLEPSLIRATRRGLRYANLGLPIAAVSLGSIDHRLRSATTAQLLAEEFGPSSILSERDLILAERAQGQPVVSARLPGQRSFHRPDLAVISEGRTIAVELELSPKGPSRLKPIIQAWRKATWVSEIRYYAQPGTTRRGVERVVEELEASDRIRILDAPPR